MKKIFLTGGRGMVGQNLLCHPHSKSYEIIAPSRKDLNLCDATQVKNFLKATKPDIVIHAAGKVGGIQANIAQPYEFLFENMQMGFNVVNAAKELEIKDLINLGSSCMYPRNASNPLKEKDILTGELEPTNEGYALAKISVAKLCVAATTKGYCYKTLVPCNLYGFWDKFDPNKSHMIPAIINKIHLSKQNNDLPIEVWGTGNARREFMFAEDLADFVYFALNNLNNIPNIINVGLGYDYSVLEYYTIAKAVLQAKGQLIFDTTKPEGMKQKVVDVTEQQSLGWTPKTDLKTGLEKTYNHFKENFAI